MNETQVPEILRKEPNLLTVDEIKQLQEYILYFWAMTESIMVDYQARIQELRVNQMNKYESTILQDYFSQ